MSLLLGVNIDHAATLRQARYKAWPHTTGFMVEPDPVALAQAAERSGADGITVHLREDRRHIQERDVVRLRECVATRLNLEMACTSAMLELALRIRPDAACLVPENRMEVTTEGGLDVAGQEARVREVTQALVAAGIEVSHFIDPEPRQIDAASRCGAPVVELHTGAFANARGGDAVAELGRLVEAARRAHVAGITVNAGHGINFVNIAAIRTIPHLHELNIGHAILSRALFSGMDEAVREMKRRMAGG